MISDSNWDYPAAFILAFDILKSDIDAYGHVNNTVYLRWIDAIAWAHSDALGMTPDHCRILNRGMAVHRHEIDYLAAAYLGDQIQVATWIVGLDNKLRCHRQFEIKRISDAKTLVRAQTLYICTDLTTGRPTRMPEEFKTAYRVDPAVAAAIAAESPT